MKNKEEKFLYVVSFSKVFTYEIEATNEEEAKALAIERMKANRIPLGNIEDWDMLIVKKRTKGLGWKI